LEEPYDIDELVQSLCEFSIGDEVKVIDRRLSAIFGQTGRVIDIQPHPHTLLTGKWMGLTCKVGLPKGDIWLTPESLGLVEE